MYDKNQHVKSPIDLVISHVSCDDIIIYHYLKSLLSKNSNVLGSYSMQSISEKLNLTKRDVKNSIKNLREFGFIQINEIKTRDKRGYFINKNFYTFPKIDLDYVKISHLLIHSSLSKKVKAFIIKLMYFTKAINADKGIAEISIDNLSKINNTSNRSINKYIKELINNKIILNMKRATRTNNESLFEISLPSVHQEIIKTNKEVKIIKEEQELMKREFAKLQERVRVLEEINKKR